MFLRYTRRFKDGKGHRYWRTFTIPKAIRGLFERDRRLLGLLSRTAYEAVRKSFQALFARKDVRQKNNCTYNAQTVQVADTRSNLPRPPFIICRRCRERARLQATLSVRLGSSRLPV